MAKASLSHQYGLTFGITAGIVHLVWAALVALNLAQPLATFVMKAHMVEQSSSILPFTLESAALLVIVALVIGYILGYVFGSVWTAVQKRT